MFWTISLPHFYFSTIIPINNKQVKYFFLFKVYLNFMLSTFIQLVTLSKRSKFEQYDIHVQTTRKLYWQNLKHSENVCNGHWLSDYSKSLVFFHIIIEDVWRFYKSFFCCNYIKENGIVFRICWKPLKVFRKK